MYIHTLIPLRSQHEQSAIINYAEELQLWLDHITWLPLQPSAHYTGCSKWKKYPYIQIYHLIMLRNEV